MRRKRVILPDEHDDGRVVASMNVDGMPWYAPERAFAPKGYGVGNADDADPVNAADASKRPAVVPQTMTRRESMAFTFGVLKAALLAALVFIGGLYLFILFCVNIWLK